MSNSSRIAVIGGGIAGLTMAYRLAKQGHRVVLMEASDQLGGLGTFFQHDGRTFEKFYHCALPTDKPLLALLGDLGLTSDLYWKPTSFGYSHKQQLYSLNGALDLLKFSPLGFIDRLRVGITGLWGRLCSGAKLDDITAVDWLTGLSGKAAFQTFWLPLLQAKFGDRYHDVPALWFWTRFNREKGDSKGECKGYLRGGYKRIIDTLAEQIKALGGEIQLGHRTVSVDLDVEGRPVVAGESCVSNFDQVVVTLPWPQAQPVIGPRLRSQLAKPLPEIDYQGVINVLFFLRRPLTPHYWVATPEPDYPFDGVIETSTLTGESDRGEGRHLVYLTKYMHRTDARMAVTEEELKTQWWTALQKLFPDLTEADREAAYVFKAPFVEPLYTRGYGTRKPPEVIAPGKVYLATAAQVYPDVTSWNGSVGQCERTLGAMANNR